jgi:hypothetical protein
MPTLDEQKTAMIPPTGDGNMSCPALELYPKSETRLTGGIARRVREADGTY